MPGGRNLFVKSLKDRKKHTFLPNNLFFLKMFQEKKRKKSWQPREEHSSKGREIFRLMSKNEIKKWFCPKILLFLKLFQGKNRRKSWQPREKHSNKGRENFRSMSKSEIKRVFDRKNYYSSKCSYGHMGCRYDESPELSMQKNGSFSINVQKWVKEFFFCGNNFPQKNPMDTQIAVLTTSLKKFQRRAENLSLTCESDNGMWFSQKKVSSSNWSYGHVKWNFYILTEKETTKGQLRFTKNTEMIQKDVFLENSFPKSFTLCTCYAFLTSRSNFSFQEV